MKILPDEEMATAVLREGNLLGKAFVDRMGDIEAMPEDGIAILASMLMQVCGQCAHADVREALGLLAAITEVAREGMPLICATYREYFQALAEHTDG